MAERIMMGLLLGGVAAGCIVVLYPFFSAILWAAILVFTTWPVFIRLRSRLGRLPAAMLMTVITAFVVVMPIGLVASASVEDAPGILAAVQKLAALGLPPAPAWVMHVPFAGRQLTESWNHWSADVSAAGAAIQPYLGLIATKALGLLVQIASGLLQLVLALFIGFFFWIGGDALGNTLAGALRRIAGTYADRLISVITATIRGTVYGILGTAIVQGFLTATGFWLVALPSPVLFGGIAAFVAVLPIGAPLVWVPAAIWLALSHHLARGIVLAVWGVVLISGADHVIRPMFIARGAQMPYLLTVLGVLGGIVAFGGLGIFLGPVLLGVGYMLTVEFSAAPNAGRPDPLAAPPFPHDGAPPRA
ncbi:AI-2E family transporter [Rhizosaccharibacter radicis]|uniref:AI-2E family transporter n=1 Tax=Rhizosaccharibacter radicis TaxID=2782605 RepID=A0ABT1VXU0_9PROT|nr:AI-2E family transporter [Acetobacteraceae bacterium KSS12]